MPLARANGCALTQSAFGMSLRKAKPGPRRDLSTTKPAAKEIEAFAASALAERNQEAAVSQAIAARGRREPGKASEAKPSCAAESVGVEADQRVGVRIPSFNEEPAIGKVVVDFGAALCSRRD